MTKFKVNGNLEKIEENTDSFEVNSDDFNKIDAIFDSQDFPSRAIVISEILDHYIDDMNENELRMYKLYKKVYDEKNKN